MAPDYKPRAKSVAGFVSCLLIALGCFITESGKVVVLFACVPLLAGLACFLYRLGRGKPEAQSQ